MRAGLMVVVASLSRSRTTQAALAVQYRKTAIMTTATRIIMMMIIIMREKLAASRMATQQTRPAPISSRSNAVTGKSVGRKGINEKDKRRIGPAYRLGATKRQRKRSYCLPPPHQPANQPPDEPTAAVWPGWGRVDEGIPPQ